MYASAAAYFAWRIRTIDPAVPLVSRLALGAELIGFARTVVLLRAAVRLPERAVPQAPAGADVDVFVTTIDEPARLVRASLVAAVGIRYPHTTWLLDDGNRAELRALAVDLGCRYLARAQTTAAKAGNLNHGLATARGAYVAVLDADHVAEPALLDRTLGYFADARVAFVQTPPGLRNHDSFDHLTAGRAGSHGQAWFHHIVQHGRDAANTTMFVGSAAVFRRAALDSIGGFATGTVNEDIHTSLRLHAAGRHSIFHPEILARGFGALDAAGYLGQRVRWAEDAVQLARMPELRRPGLTRSQRTAYVMHILSNLEGWRYLAIHATPIAILVAGRVPLRADARAFIAAYAPYALATVFATHRLGRGHGRVFEATVYNALRIPVSLIATVSAFRARRAWRVTPKTRQPAGSALPAIFPWLLVGANAGAIAYGALAARHGRSSLRGGTLAVASAWAAYHVAVGLRMIALSARCARCGERSETAMGT